MTIDGKTEDEKRQNDTNREAAKILTYKMEKNDKYLTGEMSYRILYRWWRNIAIWSKYNNEIIKVYIFPSR